MQLVCCKSIVKVFLALAGKGPVLWSFMSTVGEFLIITGWILFSHCSILRAVWKILIWGNSSGNSVHIVLSYFSMCLILLESSLNYYYFLNPNLELGWHSFLLPAQECCRYTVKQICTILGVRLAGVLTSLIPRMLQTCFMVHLKHSRLGLRPASPILYSAHGVVSKDALSTRVSSLPGVPARRPVPSCLFRWRYSGRRGWKEGVTGAGEMGRSGPGWDRIGCAVLPISVPLPRPDSAVWVHVDLYQLFRFEYTPQSHGILPRGDFLDCPSTPARIHNHFGA